VLISGAALLRALRVDSLSSWIVYGTSVVLGLYTQFFFVFVAAGHAVYVIITQGRGRTGVVARYLAASLAGLAVFVPWIVVIVRNPSQSVGWTQTEQGLFSVATRWAGIVSRAFLDLGVSPGDSPRVKLLLLPPVGLLCLLVAYALYNLIRSAPRRVWLFVATLAASAALPLLLLDVVLGKYYGTTRYILSSTVGMQLAVAWLLSTRLDSAASTTGRRVGWRLCALALVAGGIVSGLIWSRATMWWNKVPDRYGDYSALAQIVNRADRPLLCSYAGYAETQVLCRLLDEKVRLQILPHAEDPATGAGFSDVFLLGPSDSTRSRLEAACRVQRAHSRAPLWKIERHSSSP